ncbi:hypothetical protein TRICI_000033 [Trichomonascus ciferrii]|uniref:Uncharacterized protein n=1 Tax=Trichomonascus ciferrii TaxID=44093 RepID=A0A642VEK7_9ASCO|nr:hypothetical protein TRICI_000033 [Trichomonascus ciferrii]
MQTQGPSEASLRGLGTTPGIASAEGPAPVPPEVCEALANRRISITQSSSEARPRGLRRVPRKPTSRLVLFARQEAKTFVPLRRRLADQKIEQSELRCPESVSSGNEPTT